MTHLEHEIKSLREELIDMWALVVSQLTKAHLSLITYDLDLAREVIINEKRVDAMELKIDIDCENIIALYNPVAIDLRFVLATLKINNNLERTGDIAASIAKLAVQSENAIDTDLLDISEMNIMFEEAISMLKDLQQYFETEEPKLVRKIFARDELLDDINKKITSRMAEYIKTHPDKIEQALNILSSVRKIERVGDQTTNIAEETIFFIEAKVLKHKGKKKFKEQKEIDE